MRESFEREACDLQLPPPAWPRLCSGDVLAVAPVVSRIVSRRYPGRSPSRSLCVPAVALVSVSMFVSFVPMPVIRVAIGEKKGDWVHLCMGMRVMVRGSALTIRVSLGPPPTPNRSPTSLSPDRRVARFDEMWVELDQIGLGVDHMLAFEGIVVVLGLLV